jgi:hypothetical protein
MVETKNNSSQVGSSIINSFGKYQLKFYFLTRCLYQDCPILVNLLSQFKKWNFIYLYIGLFDWTRGTLFSPPMHTLMKNNEHPKTYNMH